MQAQMQVVQEELSKQQQAADSAEAALLAELDQEEAKSKKKQAKKKKQKAKAKAKKEEAEKFERDAAVMLQVMCRRKLARKEIKIRRATASKRCNSLQIFANLCKSLQLFATLLIVAFPLCDSLCFCVSFLSLSRSDPLSLGSQRREHRSSARSRSGKRLRWKARSSARLPRKLSTRPKTSARPTANTPPQTQSAMHSTASRALLEQEGRQRTRTTRRARRERGMLTTKGQS